MNTYLVIVCGNYETKIMVANFQNDTVRLLYIDEFLTNDVIKNSILIESNEFKNRIYNKLHKIKKSIGFIPNKVILNIPTKEIDIIGSTSPEYNISKYLTPDIWHKIWLKLSLDSSQLKGSHILGKRVLNWKLDGIDYLEPPFNVEGNKLIFKTQFYITKEKYVTNFLNVFDKLEIKIDEIVVDSIIIPEGFNLNLRLNKAFINIGHDKSNIFYYKNFSLTKKEIINFGLKNLTEEITKHTNVNEEDAIKFLKVYKNISSFNKREVPFKVSVENNIGKYDIFSFENINFLIKDWLNQLTKQINKFYNDLEKRNEEIDEIYILSATNIFEKWIYHIKAKLGLKVDVIYINNDNIKFNDKNVSIIGFNEPKYISLIYSLLYIHKQISDIPIPK